jgi:hypothetical protein
MSAFANPEVRAVIDVDKLVRSAVFADIDANRQYFYRRAEILNG